jgi:sialic acid synthase SpsE
VFREAGRHARKQGYHLTSSVFDVDSLRYLLAFDSERWRLPFVKIACRPDLYWLIGEVPRRIPVYVSGDFREGAPPFEFGADPDTMYLVCVPEYPAEEKDYLIFGDTPWCVSDHSIGWELFKKCPDAKIWEKHVVLEHSPDNPDAGAFACTPEELEEIL